MQPLRALAFATVVAAGVAGSAAVATSLPALNSPAIFVEGFGDINVNVSCGSQMNLDIAYQVAPELEWEFVVTTSEGDIIFLTDTDGDLMGFHPVIPADELPSGSYTYTVDGMYGEESFPGLLSGTVTCTTTEPPQPSEEPTVITPTVDPTGGVTTSPEPSTDPDGGGGDGGGGSGGGGDGGDGGTGEVGVLDETAGGASPVPGEAGYTG
ncbi:hypothetical protein [Demequina silvatica]|uniref:hypothetical protein n=1 Tax=Demequina silvatica TaxID=1638988 RepID=UPI000781D269|nr:hypothetical protein [Demequina silvatica]